MFVITIDQVGSRADVDRIGPALAQIAEHHGEDLALPADRTAGDELQALTADSKTALSLILEFTRSQTWSVGLGCGAVRTPLPDATRAASGPAFFAARDAVTRAKERPTRFALVARNSGGDDSEAGADAEALIDLVLLLRSRRTQPGWALYDLLQSGLTQQDAARKLGITPPSVSARARAAGLRAEESASGALARLLENLDQQTD
jgi:hypothetical protein